MDFPKHPVERPFRPVDFRFRPIGFSIQGRFPSQKRARFVPYSSKKAPFSGSFAGAWEQLPHCQMVLLFAHFRAAERARGNIACSVLKKRPTADPEDC